MNPLSLAGLKHVRHLRLHISTGLLAEQWASLTSLQWLDLQLDAQQLPHDLQRSLSSLKTLRHLRLVCSDTTLLGVSGLQRLTCLQLPRCQELRCMPSVAQLTQLQLLDMHGCSSLTSLPLEMCSLSILRHLDMRW